MLMDLVSEEVWPQLFCAFECRKQQCPCADPSELHSKPNDLERREGLVNS